MTEQYERVMNLYDIDDRMLRIYKYKKELYFNARDIECIYDCDCTYLVLGNIEYIQDVHFKIIILDNERYFTLTMIGLRKFINEFMDDSDLWRWALLHHNYYSGKI